MKRVLIITYYWPPAGGGGVQRWLKFAKYLPGFGWEPVIFTPENADYPLRDETLTSDINAGTEIVRLPIFEPYRWYRNVTGKKEATLSAGFIRDKKKSSVSSQLISWLRGNVILPDARRFWINPSVKFLQEYLKTHPVDVVVTTGPPHSMHMIGLKLKKKLNTRWVADFRDPWVNMDNADKLYMGKKAMNYHRKWEECVIKTADEVICASMHVARQYEITRGKKVHAITNGFDPTDFPSSNKKPGDFVIGHFGTMGDDRNPENLWSAIAQVCRDSPAITSNIKLLFVGPTDAHVIESIRNAGLEQRLTYQPYLSHEDAVRSMMTCSLLLLPLNRNQSEEGRIPGKIFEYIATGNFILGIGSPTGESARLLNESQAGVMLDYNDIAGMKRELSEQLQDPRTGNMLSNFSEKFTRKNLTGSLAEVLDAML